MMTPPEVIEREGCGGSSTSPSRKPQTGQRVGEASMPLSDEPSDRMLFFDHIAAGMYRVRELSQSRLCDADLSEVRLNGECLALPRRRAVAVEGQNSAGYQERIQDPQSCQCRLVQVDI